MVLIDIIFKMKNSWNLVIIGHLLNIILFSYSKIQNIINTLQDIINKIQLYKVFQNTSFMVTDEVRVIAGFYKENSSIRHGIII